MNTKTLLAAGLALGFACNLAAAQAVGERNGLLADAQGRTLYTFDKDAANRSACYDGCAAAWPPFTAREGAKADGRYTLVKRDDGTTQWAIDGKPLYFFAADVTPGDAKGDGQGGVWHIVRTSAAKPAKSAARHGDAYGYGSGYAY